MREKLYSMLVFLIILTCCCTMKAEAQTAADSAVIVRISSGTRYYYGNFKDSAVANGVTLANVLTAASDKGTLLFIERNIGGYFQAHFTTTLHG